LKVVAVNDRGHSRIFYEARLPFELRADGTVQGYDLADAVKSELNRMLQDPQTRAAHSETEAIQNNVIVSKRP
jgi:hypothetical protein